MHWMLSVVGALQAGAPPNTLVISLEDATRRAVTASPAVAAAAATVPALRGRRAETRWPFPENPTLEYSRARRTTGTTATRDWEWGVSQDVEVAAWAWRGSAFTAEIRSAEARVEDARRLAALEARRSYLTLALADRRAALTDSSAAFSERLAEFARRQFDAGEVNRLELNAATLEGARARSAAERVRAEAAEAAADLARLLALPLDSTPRTLPIPALPALAWPSDSVLLELARLRRPDLHSVEADRVGAERNTTAARLGLIPKVTISVFQGREDGTDDLSGLRLGLKVPLFHQEQVRIGEARAVRAMAGAKMVETSRAVQSEVVSAGARFLRARAAERRFATEVLRAATDNVALTELALAEGEVSLTEVLVLRATAVGAQLEYLEVLREASDAWFALAAALGADPAELVTLLGTGG